MCATGHDSPSRVTRCSTLSASTSAGQYTEKGVASAGGCVIEWPAIALFAILFVWQFPHFMAIGWMYRDDYAAAGIRLTPTQPDESFAARSTVIQSLFYAVIMVPVSMWPTWLGVTGHLYEVVAGILSLVYLWYTIRFSRIARAPGAAESRAYARDLLKASVIYLPLLMTAMMLDAKGRLLF